jgi:D-psicose/D-tagatose/L-ribulose 3-epimerase
MRFGCCVGITPVQPGVRNIEAIDRLEEVGFDYVEPPLSAIMELTEEEFNRLCEAANGSRLRCEAFNVFFPRRVRLTGAEASLSQIEEYVREAVQRAALLGGKVIVLGSAGSRNIPEGYPREKAWEQLVQVLQMVNPIVESAGIAIAIEPLNRGESNILNRVSEALALVKDVDRPNIGLLVDYYHFSLEGERLESLLPAASALRHVHFAQVEGRAYPTEMKPGYKELFGVLGSIGYDGRISIEAAAQDWPVEAARALDLMRSL